MRLRYADLLHQANIDDDVKVLVIRANGPNLGSGADLPELMDIMSGRSDRHVAGLARHVEETLRAQGQRCLGVEGLPQASWLLMDFGDVIVHVFHQDTRGYYDLERLWIDAARVAVE